MPNDEPQKRESREDAAISRVARLLAGQALSAGDLAELRRMEPRRPPAAFFKVEGLALDDCLPSGADAREEAETRWAAIVVSLAHLGSLHQTAAEGFGLTLGHALARAGYAEGRFAKLLQADAERLIDEVPMLARFLAAKGMPVDFTLAGRLLLSAGRERDEERVRRRLARDYYGALARAQNS